MVDFPSAPPSGGSGGGGSLVGNVLSSLAASIAKAINNISLSLSSVISTKTPTSLQLAVTGTVEYPLGAKALMATSGSVSNATAQATLPLSLGSTVYITGFDVTAQGATTTNGVVVTVAGTHNNMQYLFWVPGNINVSCEPLSIRYHPPIPANDTASSITVTVPALGAGSANCIVTAYGFYV